MATPIELAIDKVAINIIERPPNLTDGLPYATHWGVLKIMDMELTVYILNTGERIIDRDSLMKLFPDPELWDVLDNKNK